MTMRRWPETGKTWRDVSEGWLDRTSQNWRWMWSNYPFRTSLF